MHACCLTVSHIIYSLVTLALCCRYAKALLLGLAFSSNFGGMMSPISSLQNILAVSNLEKVRQMCPYT